MYSPLKSLKVLPYAYIQFDLNNTLLHFQPVKVSLRQQLCKLQINIYNVIINIWLLPFYYYYAITFNYFC